MSNIKSLYTGNYAHSDEARNLAHNATEAVKNIIDEHVALGYSPNEIEQVICCAGWNF